MINHFSGIGNLGTAPTLRTVEVDGEPRKVADLRVYFDRRVGENYGDKGGFWLNVDIWGYRAEEAARLLKKGARVYLSGTLRQEAWTDEPSQEARVEMRLSADYFFLDTICLESVQYRSKKTATRDGQHEAA